MSKQETVIQCPSCNSTLIKEVEKRGNNGVIGPGYQSWVEDSWLSCQRCGCRFDKTDLPNSKEQETVTIKVPRWRKFSEELPDTLVDIYVIVKDRLQCERFYDESKRSNYFVVMESGFTYPITYKWIYAKSERHPEGLDLTALLPGS